MFHGKGDQARAREAKRVGRSSDPSLLGAHAGVLLRVKSIGATWILLTLSSNRDLLPEAETGKVLDNP